MISLVNNQEDAAIIHRGLEPPRPVFEELLRLFDGCEKRDRFALAAHKKDFCLTA